MPNPQERFDALAEGLPIGRDPASVRRRIEAMEKLLERMFTLPGTNRQFGLDVVFDLIPVGGSLVAAAMGSWLVWEARNLGMSKWHLARMAGNIGVDFLLGAIPWVGDHPDFFFKSNTPQPADRQALARQAPSRDDGDRRAKWWLGAES